MNVYYHSCPACGHENECAVDILEKMVEIPPECGKCHKPISAGEEDFIKRQASRKFDFEILDKVMDYNEET